MSVARNVLKRSHYHTLIEREMPHWPGVRHEYQKRAGGHLAVKLTYEGRSRFVVFPASASDYRGALNNIADIRKELKGMGAERRDDGPAKVRKLDTQRPRLGSAPDPKPPTITDPRDGGFGPLALLRAKLTEQSSDEVRRILLRWLGSEVVPERLDEAARALVASWHPDIIERAHELLVAARRPHER